ncbi:hypothetical protein NT6N_28940 [Oceaniferula spumae]|uniref:Zinc ribbon domain-containing protein n=1 Tax=Oceaniferula spumae TaxID=2979115 RepID=A0AAT9FPD1_9BACT
MPAYAYTLSFPCPDCGGILTMHSPEASGCCPLCNCDLKVNLSVEKNEIIPINGEEDNQLAWEKRAFRKCKSAV